MKNFMKEYSKAVLVIFLCICSFVIVCYEVQCFLALLLDKVKPDTTVPSLAFTAGFTTILGSFVKSFLEKNSLNKNGLKIVGENVVRIDAFPKIEPEEIKDDSDEQPEEKE